MDDVRARALKRRNALSREERIQYSRRICERVQPLLHGIVALYRAVGSEVDLSYLNKSGLHLCLPACSNADMRFYHIDESTEYRKSRFGIWEPVHALPAEASQLDIVLVPLVAFDEACNRWDMAVAIMTAICRCAEQQQSVSPLNVRRTSCSFMRMTCLWI